MRAGQYDRALQRFAGCFGQNILWIVVLWVRSAPGRGVPDLHPPRDGIIDPKAIPPEYYQEHHGPTCDIPSNCYVLGRTLEYLRIPRDVLTLCLGKSTYARAGVLINVTPFEPEWEGYATISIANTTPVPVRIYANEGLCQVLFFQSDEPCEISYRDRKGKYQAQKKIEFAKTDKPRDKPRDSLLNTPNSDAKR